LAVSVVIFLALFGIAIVAPETMIEEMRKQFPDDKITVECKNLIIFNDLNSFFLQISAWFLASGL
jgi:hypothetical protein